MSRENIIGENLKQFRKSLGLSQNIFGKTIGLRKQDVSAIETGRRQIGLPVLMRVATEHNMSIDWCVFGEGAMFRGEKEADTI